MTENNSATNKYTMANSLLSAAHSLLDENNLLVLQDVSLQDEPEPPPLAPATSNSGVFSEVDLINPVVGLNAASLQPSENLDLGNDTYSTRSGDKQEIKSPLQQNVEFSATMKYPNEMSDIKEQQKQHDVHTSAPATNYASSLFGKFDGGHDPFHAAMRPPLQPKVEMSHAVFPPPPGAGTMRSTVPSEKSSTITGSESAITYASTFSQQQNAATIISTVMSDNSVPLYTPAQSFGMTFGAGDSVSSRMFSTTFANTGTNQMPPQHSAVASTSSGLLANTYPAGGGETPAIPLFTPSTTFNLQMTAPNPATTSSVFNPNPVILPNSPWDGFTVLPPQGSPQGNSNQFRMTTQKPTYAQYPGINSSGIVSQPPQLDFTQPLAKLTDPPLPAPESLYPTLPSQDFTQQDPSMAQFYGFGGPPTPNHQIYQYNPLQYYWFYNRETDGRNYWKPFSIVDSTAIEQAFNSGTENMVRTDGGRYDVDINKRVKQPAFWEESHQIYVRRCSWFYKGPLDSRFVPYDEEFSVWLEAEFYKTITTGCWHKRIDLGGGELIVFHDINTIAHFCQDASPDEWGNMPENQLRPRVLKRGVQEFEMEEGESDQIDHLVLVVHGIGSICDFKFQNPVEAVDEFRSVAQQLSQSHFREAISSKKAGRIEFLPIQWHAALHGEGGTDDKLKPITLNSIPKLRSFTNDTLLDILFYTSPVYNQTVVTAVGNEINRIYNLFKSRHSNFNGMVGLAGHSLGSLIVFDILMNQPAKLPDKLSDDPSADKLNSEIKVDEKNQNIAAYDGIPLKKTHSRTVTYTVSSNGTGVQLVNYPLLHFHPSAFFAMGSPIAMFVTVRGLDQLGTNFRFPTVPSFFNIFHPFDPVAYRMEPLIDPKFDLRPVLIPHHKGRKRFHLELKETMARVGTDIKNRVMESLKVTWNTVYQYASFGRSETINDEIDRAIEGELANELKGIDSDNQLENEEEIRIGSLNGGNRIDFVLQEAPMETLNEYLFALASHVCYWSSEDTVLLILKELYKKLSVHADTSSTTSIGGTVAVPSSPSIPIYNPAEYKPIQAQTSTGPPNTTYNNSSTPSSVTPSAPPLPLFNQAEIQPPPLPFLYANETYMNTKPKSTGKIALGGRPLVSADQFPVQAIGVDPTAPISSNTTVGPPPLGGFIASRKQ